MAVAVGIPRKGGPAKPQESRTLTPLGPRVQGGVTMGVVETETDQAETTETGATIPRERLVAAGVLRTPTTVAEVLGRPVPLKPAGRVIRQTVL